MKKMMMIAAVIFLFFCLLVCLTGCTIRSGDESGAENFGAGVYYFSATGDDFGKSLAAIKERHPNLKVTAIAPKDAGIFGTLGYWVNFEEK